MTDVHVPAAAKPAIIGSAITAWRDAFAAINSMPTVMGVAFVIVLALNAVGLLLLPSPSAEPAPLSLSLQIASFGLAIVQSFLLAPVAIAVHRFVLLGELTGGYSINPSDQRFQRFFGFAVLLSALMTIPSAMMGLFLGRSDWGALGMAIGSIVLLVLLIVACIVSLRTVILFPAIAVDAPGAQWGNALADSKGHSWRLLFILIVTAVPFAVIFGLLYWLLLRPSGLTLFSGVVYVLLQAITQVPAIAAFAAMASRLFAAFSGRLGYPPR
jgi:hypothetical protein